jgi:hypothetical protein
MIKAMCRFTYELSYEDFKTAATEDRTVLKSRETKGPRAKIEIHSFTILTKP